MISIIICSINPQRFHTIVAHYTKVMGNEPFEIIGVHDARSLCEGYNRGFAQSRGDILIFSHDDIEFWTDSLVPRLKELLGEFDVVGVAGTTLLSGASWVVSGPPFLAGMVIHSKGAIFEICLYGGTRRSVPNIQAMDGLFLACRRNVAQQIPWDAERFFGFHCYDVDWTFRAFQAGFKLAVALDLPVLHYSTGNYDANWQQFAATFNVKHAVSLARLNPRHFQFASVHVTSKQDAIQVLQAAINQVR